ncbi:type VI secretion system baseplate subunit TssF [Photobacterium sp. 1_MG-2023]|uniref:type VI secretion system baseplate subunit TssF n=1 Tax=Photobacterium sp. 1_MG-2023 TaxID=3062646 RepID=UPI0026E2CADE|nr:type VI secretion system baseplate subunit TssF [Photobacterium sp. 1_MG-2023]MDO6708561.1 type VI secretion system baseplate subunit TssF [Photobacterium sp. 1_MG-2023]
MTYSKYFQDELSFLKEAGSEFSKSHPQLTKFLSESSNDPDVERLLEGFAFLNGKLRQKLDDELPELTQSLIALLWPHYLRSVPSMSIAQLKPHEASVTQKTTVTRGHEMASTQVDDSQCIFRTCYDVDLYPLILSSVTQQNTRSNSHLNITLTTDSGVELSRIGLDTLRFHIHGELHISRILYLWLFRYLDSVEVVLAGGGSRKLPASCIQKVGFDDDQSLMPYGPNSFSGYRLVQEYFAMPDKFMFFDIVGLDWLKGVPNQNTMSLVFNFSRSLPSEVTIREKNLRLFCTPIANVFDMDADPIRLDHKRTEYHVRPQSSRQQNFEVYSVNQVRGWSNENRRQVDYLPFESFEHQLGIDHQRHYYNVKVSEHVTGKGLSHYISFFDHNAGVANLETETVLIKLTCTNGKLPQRLAPGDISFTTHKSTNYADFTNLTKPTVSVSPQIDSSLHWQLIANMSLNYLSLIDTDVLKMMLSIYDFHSRSDRQSQRASANRLNGIKAISMKPVERIYRGLPIRGNLIELQMDSAMFANEGDMYLLVSILNEFFSLYSSINSFSELEVVDVKTGEIYRWDGNQGKQAVI